MKGTPLHSGGLGYGLVVAAIFFTITANSILAIEPRMVPDIGLKLMPVPAGTFTMGSPRSEKGSHSEEGPQTRVTISSAFWLGQTEVTHAQWRAVMGTDLSQQVRLMLADDTLYDLGGEKKQTLRDNYKKTKHSDPNELVYNGNASAPVYWVSWDEAVAFCRRLTEREREAGRLAAGLEYRLPTEAEWEYACRAGTSEATYAGKMEIKGEFNAPVLDAIAWYGGNSSVGWTGRGVDTTKMREKQYPGGVAAPRDVGTKRANAWGLHDMLGNVFEWCGDWYHGDLPGGDVRDPNGPASGNDRIMRGGGWDFGAKYCRAASRDAGSPGERFHDVGFRVALCVIR